MFDLETMSIADLEQLIKDAQEVLKTKKLEESQEFEFTFEATSDPRNGRS